MKTGYVVALKVVQLAAWNACILQSLIIQIRFSNISINSYEFLKLLAVI